MQIMPSAKLNRFEWNLIAIVPDRDGDHHKVVFLGTVYEVFDKDVAKSRNYLVSENIK